MASCGGRLSAGVILQACQLRSSFIGSVPTSISFSRPMYSSSGKWTTTKTLISLSSSSGIQKQCACAVFRHVPSRSLCEDRSNVGDNNTGRESASASADQTHPQQQKTKKPADRIVRVTPARKQPPPPDSPTPATSSIPSSLTNGPALFVNTSKLIGAAKAKSEYCLTDEHLKGLETCSRRSPFIGEPPCEMYSRADVLAKALSVHGSEEALEAARARARTLEFISEADSNGRSPQPDSPFFSLPPPTFLNEDKTEDAGSSTTAKRKGIGSAAWRNEGTERVVLAAVAVNLGALVVKLGAWWYTGSHSLMAESLHSLADTINQVLVAYGVHQSLRKPDKMHPYGYSNVRYLTSLISGIGIFYVGSAMSLYHGVRGLWHAAPLESLPVGLCVLAVAFCGDGVTFLMARRAIQAKAIASGMTASHYIRTGEDPSLSVVYLEDRASLYGVGIAIASISLSFYLDNPIPDSIGSMCIGLVLFQVAYKIIAMNVDQLLGKSIPLKEIDQITQTLEADPVVRSIQDIKATELGAGEIRFKAEIDFDGRNITRAYLKTVDLRKILQEAQSLKNQAELEQFLMKHGDGITDRQGAEIDRIEQALKKKFPDIRHVDLEAL